MRQKFSGCHWTPRQKRAAGSSIASMTPSGAVADDAEAGRDRLDRLMMPAVDLAGVAAAEPFAHQLRQQRVLLDPDLVRERVRLVRRDVRLCVSAPGTCDGMSCTSVPPHGDVQHLHAAADREDRADRARERRRRARSRTRRAPGRHPRPSDAVLRRTARARRRRRRSAAGRRCRPARPSTGIDGSRMRTSPPAWRTDCR